jgi:hypothetical protein
LPMISGIATINAAQQQQQRQQQRQGADDQADVATPCVIACKTSATTAIIREAIHPPGMPAAVPCTTQLTKLWSPACSSIFNMNKCHNVVWLDCRPSSCDVVTHLSSSRCL